ncbi:phytochrome kinase substrate-related family protein [Striga asiatica]|uniref:Phytochrome kinase substrate-related family protein n=1 Tax=Striga asiatica TaxID=4170 RepID=A0A5A7PAC8_STRAF|nr:phytochrome kinase substrate-related family protein [Striga asiatica]
MAGSGFHGIQTAWTRSLDEGSRPDRARVRRRYWNAWLDARQDGRRSVMRYAKAFSCACWGITDDWESLDDPPTQSIAATECSVPSEGNVAWSVSTAECFDKASISNFAVSASEAHDEACFWRGAVEEGMRRV